MLKKFSFFALLMMISSLQISAQPERWQQQINYKIDASLDVQKNTIKGTEEILYTNNSTDTLRKVYFHMYWNAFQPNSNMDLRSRELGKTILGNRRGEDIKDWDMRVRDRIQNLKPEEYGIQKVNTITINGKAQQLIEHETILEVVLTQPILPKSSVKMNLNFEAQVPLQIRRSGRDNKEGVRYSMSQWYPKMVEYDYQGWNTNPYIAREFYGVWGNYDVTLRADKSYMIGGTGTLQNATAPLDKDGHKVWNFKGNNIHDFVWFADNNFKHLSKEVRKGLTLHVYYKAKDAKADSAWANVLWAAEKVLPFMEQKMGAYPYPQYSFIQGGDGGMEYAMATLLVGPSLGTAFHEWIHSWYQHILGSNESLFAWMDEGFTSYGEEMVSHYYETNFATQSPYISEAAKKQILVNLERQSKLLPAVQNGNYSGYIALAKSGYEEPMSTHADHFNTNYAYSSAAYAKGGTFLGVLGYMMGEAKRDQLMLNYYNTWKFKHPNVNDFIRVAEKTSGLQLQWLKEYWVNSTKTIDYGLNDIQVSGNAALISIQRVGKFPMPIEVVVTYKDGSSELHYIPLDLMLGGKVQEGSMKQINHPEWKWTHPTYTFESTQPLSAIKSIEIDPSQRMPDINRSNNKIEIPN
jgi:hypothetical protein